MNENIKKLAKEVGLLERPAITWSAAPVEANIFTNEMIEEFVELLIGECCEQARDEVQSILDWDKADQVTARIKQHFGLWK